MVERTGSDDFEWVVEAIEIHREVGGDLTEVLDHVGETIRSRTRIARQVDALSAEGKISAIVLLSLPFGIGLFIWVSNPDYLRAAVRHDRRQRDAARGRPSCCSPAGCGSREIVKPEF